MGRGIHSGLSSKRSSFSSALRTLRGFRYLFRLVTGKRMGFSAKGPFGMRFHFNANGTLRSYSLKAFAGMRVVCNSNGAFKKLSLPGPFRSRIFVDSKGDFAGFALPRVLGGFLLYDKNGNLKRAYGPSIGGMCASRDVDGVKRKHETRGKKKSTIISEAAREVIPEAHKTYSRRGENTPEGIKPIPSQDMERFQKKPSKKEKREAKIESQKRSQKARREKDLTVKEERAQTTRKEKVLTVKEERLQTTREEKVQVAKEERTQTTREEKVQAVRDDIATGKYHNQALSNGRFSWEDSKPKEEPELTPAEKEQYTKQLASFDKTVETSFADTDEVPFDDLF